MRHQLFAGAALATDQNRNFQGSNLDNLRTQFAYRRGVTDEVFQSVSAPAQHGSLTPVVLHLAFERVDPAHHAFQLVGTFEHDPPNCPDYLTVPFDRNTRYNP